LYLDAGKVRATYQPTRGLNNHKLEVMILSGSGTYGEKENMSTIGYRKVKNYIRIIKILTTEEIPDNN
jgi:hypothetical protein